MRHKRTIELGNGKLVAVVEVQGCRGYWQISDTVESWTLDGRMSLDKVWDWLLYDYGRNYFTPLRYRL